MDNNRITFLQLQMLTAGVEVAVKHDLLHQLPSCTQNTHMYKEVLTHFESISNIQSALS